MGLQIMKIPSAMEVVPRYRLLVHCLHCFHCMHACISYTYIQYGFTDWYIVMECFGTLLGWTNVLLSKLLGVDGVEWVISFRLL